MTVSERWSRITEHFGFQEIFYPGKAGTISEADAVNAWRLCDGALERIRAEIGKPLTVTSGKRASAYNHAIGGSRKSDHLYIDEAAAADVSFADLADNLVAGQWLLDQPWFAAVVGQLIFYPYPKTGEICFLHISLRSRRHSGEVLIKIGKDYLPYDEKLLTVKAKKKPAPRKKAEPKTITEED